MYKLDYQYCKYVSPDGNLKRITQDIRVKSSKESQIFLNKVFCKEMTCHTLSQNYVYILGSF